MRDEEKCVSCGDMTSNTEPVKSGHTVRVCKGCVEKSENLEYPEASK